MCEIVTTDDIVGNESYHILLEEHDNAGADSMLHSLIVVANIVPMPEDCRCLRWIVGVIRITYPI